MKRFVLLFLCVALAGVASTQAQVIRMTRVDALPEKSHFITATLPFSVEISIEGVSNVTAVSFELRYNNAGSVQLSGYAGGSFGSNGLLVVDRSNRVSGAGSINVGVLSGQPAGGGGVSDPIVVRLDFITTPDALHNTNTVFSFINAEAVANGSIVRLAGVPVVYNVHGFVDVWPGDADNNGIVDTRDISIIGLFFDDGGPDGRIRGFSRKPASTAWGPQTALAWDSVRVTYADADGSGKVDINDLLVVYANFSKTHTKFGGGKGEVLSATGGERPAPLSPTSFLVPVTIEAAHPVLGVAATVTWKDQAEKFRVIGFQRGEAFAGSEGFFTKISDADHSAQFAVGNFFPAQEQELNGAVIYLVVEPLNGAGQEFEVTLDHPVGVRRSGALVPLGPITTGVGETAAVAQPVLYPNPAADRATVSLVLDRPGTVTLSLLDAPGRVVYRTVHRSASAGEIAVPLDVSAVAAGAYYLVIETAGGTTTRPFSVVR